MDNILSGDAQFFIEKVLLSNRESYPKEVEDKLEVFLHQRINKPIVYVGITSSSVIAGALETLNAIKEYIAEHDLDIEIIPVGSIGLCSYEPVVDVQLPGKCRVSFKDVKHSEVQMLLDGVLNSYLPIESTVGQYYNTLYESWPGIPYMHELDFFRFQTRFLLSNCGVIDPTNIYEYLAKGGYKALAKTLNEYTYAEVCHQIEKSGLRGRGGGGYRTGEKWQKALQHSTDQRYLICNADESDPGSFKDRLLLESDPHRIIEGIIISAYAVGAHKAFIYVKSRYELTIERIENAINQAYSHGLLGHNILNSGFSIEIKVIKSPGAYVCGEETALIRSIEGKRGMPLVKPPYPSEVGLFGKPTIVNNIETLANIPDIMLKGHEWFASTGTETSKGTKVFSVSGKSATTCLIEIPMGTPVSKLVELAGGVQPGKKLKAILIGGPSGGCVLPEEINVPIDFEKLGEIGLTMGSGGIQVIDDTVCIIDLVKYFMGFIQNESCGKCIPCREGSRRMSEILDNITRRPVADDGHNTLERFKGVIHLESIAEVMKDTSLCRLGQSAPNPVLGTIRKFRDEYEEHIFERNCKAGVCRDLRTFYIDVEKCNGCTACAKKCPTNAIYGSPRSPYFVVEEKCIGCGVCLDTCKFGAVFFK